MIQFIKYTLQIKRDYKKWTDEDKNRLLFFIGKNQNYNGKIYWDLVQKQFPDRTAAQCKHYYQNILKLKEELFTPSEMFALYFLMFKYGPDMNILRRYFPNKTQSAFELPFEQVNQCRIFYTDVFFKLSRDEELKLSQFEHRLLIIVLRLIKYRHWLYVNPGAKQMPEYCPELKKLITNLNMDPLLKRTTLHEAEICQIERAEELFGIQKLFSKIEMLEKWYAEAYGDISNI
ncbi:Myb-like_DNA-binding domain-containing protein [Hexamita inflata]|uniref:Myb-like DNA-binding domain-containing protein n=1 Tax=Hexamita inflata TaxID=28002 RepID=A0AA86V3C9_9EUKA|nr:Myb-like DNA-binding domain-containing protein [Hexamita inflata]